MMAKIPGNTTSFAPLFPPPSRNQAARLAEVALRHFGPDAIWMAATLNAVKLARQCVAGWVTSFAVIHFPVCLVWFSICLAGARALP
ncbi:MAG: hypothetical protein IPM27_12070 [Nitrosomonadales bacterium]|nr:hypothetical protein [Nitrosomonadales bacterium]